MLDEPVVVVPAKVYENVDPTLVMMKTPFSLVPQPERSVQLVTVAVEDGLVGPPLPPQATAMIASVVTRTGQSCVVRMMILGCVTFYCFASDTPSLKVVVVGAGQDSLPEHVSVTELAAVPDIAALLVATIVHTAVKVVVIVFPPDGRRPTRVKVIVTALPETEPLIELVRMVTSLLNGNWTLPESDDPV